MSSTEPDPALESFVEHRNLLFTIAYEITGTVTDAEDVVQESYLRWRDAAGAQIRNPRAYLARIATRQALNRNRGNARRREDYVGPWLPEPLITAPDVAEDAVLADSVSMAMMVVLDSLTPDERAVFVLREVFAFGHDEIAEAIGKTPAAVRQIAHRARSGVQARRPSPSPSPSGSGTAPSSAPRAGAASSSAAASSSGAASSSAAASSSGAASAPGAGAAAARRSATAQQVAEKFLRAAATGQLQDLLDVLAPDVVMISDGGGKVSAGLRPIRTADKVARFLVGIQGKGFGGPLTSEPVLVNGRPGILGYVAGVLDTVLTWDVVDGRIAAIYLVRNPDKVGGAGTTRTLAR